ncbi:hypothetical protein GHI93_08845 [Lactococcus hircilactis]|uniref:Uncharacterized protein n=1 Tax=Lactococcus hircilactis TaxID=1494462 RepID=A0A7X1Z903_9LACT|nr:hypothetical protein [Lactococcus hircilactis]MQW40033.1 hypothetical protein [Lactococcus hircilactis]
MAILLALLAGLGSLVNFMFLSNHVLQGFFTVLSVLSMVFYRGKRSVKSYNRDGTRLMTIGFAICFVSFLGSAAILLGDVLHLI